MVEPELIAYVKDQVRTYRASNMPRHLIAAFVRRNLDLWTERYGAHVAKAVQDQLAREKT